MLARKPCLRACMTLAFLSWQKWSERQTLSRSGWLGTGVTGWCHPWPSSKKGLKKSKKCYVFSPFFFLQSISVLVIIIFSFFCHGSRSGKDKGRRQENRLNSLITSTPPDMPACLLYNTGISCIVVYFIAPGSHLCCFGVLALLDSSSYTYKYFLFAS